MTTDPMAKPPVVVIGAGIVGVFCALYLRKAGCDVVVVDRLAPGEATSYGNAGVISPWSFVPQCMPGTLQEIPGWLLSKDGPVAFRWRDLPTTLPWTWQFLSNTRVSRVRAISAAMACLMADSVTSYRYFLAGTGQDHLVRDSMHVNVVRGSGTITSLDDLPWQLRAERGASLEIVRGDQVRDVEPALGPDCHTAVLIHGGARAMAPGLLCKALAQVAASGGVRFETADVQSLGRNASGYELHTRSGVLPASQVVMAAGIWSADLLKPLGIELPLIAERGYHLEVVNPGVTLNHSVNDMSGKFIVSSMQGGMRAAGTAEFADKDAAPRYRRADLLAEQMRRLMPGIDLSGEKRRWMGVRPTLPDNLPAIGEFGSHSGLFAAFGHSHWGMSMAPGTGRLIADAVSGQALSIDPAAFSPERFR